MVESFMISNQDFEWQHLVVQVVIRDPRVIRGAGGEEDVGGFRENGMVTIPKNQRNLCGFIAFMFHCRQYRTALLDDMSSVFDIIDRLKYTTCSFAVWVKQAVATSRLYELARDLKTLINVDDNLTVGGRFDVCRHGKAIVDMFPKMRILIIDENASVMTDMCGDLFYSTYVNSGNSKMDEYTITLLYKDDHFDYIQNLSVYYRRIRKRTANTFFCNVCLKEYQTCGQNRDHILSCKLLRCDDCLKPFTDPEDLDKHNRLGMVVKCTKCLMYLRTGECFEHHLRYCGEFAKRTCPQCGNKFQSLEEHVCIAKKPCQFCGKRVQDFSVPHDCVSFIEPLEPPARPLSVDDIYAFDIECMAIADSDTGLNVHVPNLIIARQLSSVQLLRFDTVDEFLDFLVTINRSVTFFAHNFGGYDGRVMFKYFVNHPTIRLYNAIPNGSKFMAYTLTNGNEVVDENGKSQPVFIRFKDSYRHMSQSLRSLPKTYGLDTSKFRKGFYPHSFNTPENRFYIGPMPHIHYYHPDEMHCEERKEFLQWYQQQIDEGRVFDHYKEFVEYCESDVNVLAEALLVYMNEYMLQCNGLNPLEKVTIASHCMTHYRVNHMSKDRIPKLKEKDFKYVQPAFFGGRTHPCSLLVENDRIGYVDVNSLYPAVMTKCPLPCGKLVYKRIGGQIPHSELLQMHGVFTVDIEPTRFLYHPIIIQRDPNHGRNIYNLEPLVKVRITSIELHEAIRNGYRVTHVYSALLTDVCTDLFKTYIYEAQTAKLLATGTPPEFDTEEGKQRFIREYRDEMGVDLTGKKFEKNPGKRATAKLTNNSLWGKFGESSTRTKMSVYRLRENGVENEEDKKKYLEMMNQIFSGELLFCQNFTWTEEDTQVTYLFTRAANEDYNEELKDSTNIMLCAFVTANARMVLWQAMNKLGDRVLYCDTDSIVYILDDDPRNNIESSSKLGEWKDECEGDVITDFVSIAPKTYAYKTLSGKSVIKCKGVTLNHENSSKVTFETLKDLVTGNVSMLETNHLYFDCRPKNHYEVNTVYRKKITQLNRDMLKGELLMKDNEYGLNLPRDYMIFPKGFQLYIDELKGIYNKRSR